MTRVGDLLEILQAHGIISAAAGTKVKDCFADLHSWALRKAKEVTKADGQGEAQGVTTEGATQSSTRDVSSD